MKYCIGRLDREALVRETGNLHELAKVVANTKDADTICAALEACVKANEAIGFLLKLGTLDYATSLAITFSLNDVEDLKKRGLVSALREDIST